MGKMERKVKGLRREACIAVKQGTGYAKAQLGYTDVKNHYSILDEYVALKREGNPRANIFYSTHRTYIDELVEELLERLKVLECSDSKRNERIAKNIKRRYGHLLFS